MAGSERRKRRYGGTARASPGSRACSTGSHRETEERGAYLDSLNERLESLRAEERSITEETTAGRDAVSERALAAALGAEPAPSRESPALGPRARAASPESC